jgi:hypothetical protein
MNKEYVIYSSFLEEKENQKKGKKVAINYSRPLSNTESLENFK